MAKNRQIAENLVAAADGGWYRRRGQEPRLVAQRVLRQYVLHGHMVGVVTTALTATGVLGSIPPTTAPVAVATKRVGTGSKADL